VLEILIAGGWAMVPILLCSAVALAIILERFWSLRRKTVVPPELGEQVLAWARTRKLDPGHIETLRANSPLGEILAAALSVRNRSREIIKERVEDTGRHVVHRLERFLNTLGTIAGVSPLLGLLGTVTGIIKSFNAIQAGGMGDPRALSGGIGESLVATAAGLIVAIPALLAHRALRAKVDNIVIAIEKDAIRLADALEAAQGRQA
jgi:biopolymer transport protein ExbB